MRTILEVERAKVPLDLGLVGLVLTSSDKRFDLLLQLFSSAPES